MGAAEVSNIKVSIAGYFLIPRVYLEMVNVRGDGPIVYLYSV